MKAVKNKANKEVKKSAAKKTGVKAGAVDASADAGRESLAKELRGLIPRLDSEGLAFLVEQARVHLYNMQVEKLNMAAQAADAASARTSKISRGRGAQKSAGGNLRIDGSESGSSYYLHYRNDELMLSRDEMVRLVKIANGAGTDLEIRERLYNWFDRERKDAFSVIPMADKFDEHLKALAALIRKNFKIRNG